MRRFDGKDVEPHQLEANGEDLAARVWGTLEAQRKRSGESR